jgi:hypothetical protein
MWASMNIAICDNLSKQTFSHGCLFRLFDLAQISGCAADRNLFYMALTMPARRFSPWNRGSVSVAKSRLPAPMAILNLHKDCPRCILKGIKPLRPNLAPPATNLVGLFSNDRTPLPAAVVRCLFATHSEERP